MAEDSVRGAFQSARLAQARAVHLASGVRPKMDSTEYAPMAARRALEALDELAEQCRTPEPDAAAIGRLIEANGRRFVAITLDARRKISPRR